ncbi:hypothetical protein N7539_009216 [Penicillium diatomitis]|uniref:FR47-like domain-containing protein n=1 Tax=Penicillium diatomitis TaxID=2819901 RepID=A0A9X0BJR2_9EURO|nr:uncharacterized protein N7539_009216 [Penicillium diatomitis]KAJ5469598.1 hypothetical protein N7539_009216 [Penicillium diatomitis]
MSPLPTAPQIEPCAFYEHSAQSIIPHLAGQMPYASPVLRRIQHSLSYPSPTAKILATFPPGSAPGCISESATSSAPATAVRSANLSSTSGSGSVPSSPTPWLAAHVDLFRGRETQILLYSSLEAECTLLPQINPVADSISPGAVSRYPELDTSATPAKADQFNKEHPSLTIGTHTSEASSGNAPLVPKYAVASLSTDSSRLKTAQHQLLSLLSHLKSHLLPEYLSSLPNGDSSEATASLSASTPMVVTTTMKNEASSSSAAAASLIPPPDPRAFLIGTLHTGLFELLLESGKYPRLDLGGDTIHSTDPDPIPGLRIHRFDNPPYYKYYFPRAKFSPRGKADIETPLPSGYRYHDRRGRRGVLPFQLDLVQSRTTIPRPRRQLLTLPSVAIYHDDGTASSARDMTEGSADGEMPIAWAFLGVDGAVATLFVEPDHRGRGLALALSMETMRKGMSPDGVFGAKQAGVVDERTVKAVEGWVHAEVAGFNWASRRVMEKIGGEVLTTAIWTVIEVL